MNTINFQNIMGTDRNGQHVLGKFLYFSLSNLLVDKDELTDLCNNLGLPYGGGARVSVTDAFRSATGDTKERIVQKEGQTVQIYQVYCRDNRREKDMLSRELVKETVGKKSNTYEKLANIQYHKDADLFTYDNVVYDSHVDAGGLCVRAEELFYLYQKCANRKQIETICQSYLRSLEATKISGNGYLYFVPRHTMAQVDIFEDFIALVNKANKNDNQLSANSFYIIDDEKQRAKMTEEFYAAVKKEIAEYQERAAHFIDTGSQSPAIMERWAAKIDTLEEKKQHYETVLQRELHDLDEEFSTLRMLGMELSARSRKLRFPSAA